MIMNIPIPKIYILISLSSHFSSCSSYQAITSLALFFQMYMDRSHPLLPGGMHTTLLSSLWSSFTP